MNEVERIPAVPAILDQHLMGKKVEVIIRLPDGTEYYTDGTFRETSLEVDYVEVDRSFKTGYVPTTRHFRLHLVKEGSS